MRTTFDGQIALLHKELIEMGALCEESIAISAKALDKGDSELAKEVFDYTVKIDQKERDIETMCIRLFMKQQPVAKDLRVISSALKMVTDIERIGVNSGDIAEIVTMGHISAEQDKLNIKDMACSTIKMVTDSIDSFVQNDMELAKSVIEYDDVVDSHFDRIKTALTERIRKFGGDGEYTLDLLMIAKYYERMGDHASEIARWVLYSLTGNKEG